jgi:hypothetical protein
MAIVEELLELEDTTSEVVDFAPVSPKKSTTPASPVPAPAETPGWNPSRLGNLAQWASAIVSVFAIVLTLWFHYTANASIASDEHVGTIVDAKLHPAVKDINENISKQLSPINDQLKALTQQVGQLQGRFEQLDSGQKKLGARLGQQEALNRLQDPRRILATIRAEIQFAENEKRTLPTAQLADYRDAVQALPASAYEYWTTVAAIINYQSRLNQMSGEAPDPTKVAEPCLGENARYNVFFGARFRNCMVVLDTESFNHATFQDSVIIYHGGPVSLNEITFVNCRFVLDFPPQHELPADKSLVLALLASPDQKSVHVSR